MLKMKTAIMLFVALLGFLLNLDAKLILDNGQPDPAILKLYEILNKPNNGTLDEICEIAHDTFARKKGIERWQISSSYEDLSDQVLPIFESLGMIDEKFPSKNTYDAVIVFGTTVNGMRNRVKYLERLWSEGIRFTEVVFLSGERFLDPNLESEDVLFTSVHSPVPFRPGWKRKEQLVNTEFDAAMLVWDQVVSDEELRNMKVTFVSASQVFDQTWGKKRRPNTADTVHKWISDCKPAPQNYLAISSNPYIDYQDAVTRVVLLENGLIQRGATLETIGSHSNAKNVATYLDVLPWQLYCEKKVIELLKGMDH